MGTFGRIRPGETMSMPKLADRLLLTSRAAMQLPERLSWSADDAGFNSPFKRMVTVRGYNLREETAQ